MAFIPDQHSFRSMVNNVHIQTTIANSSDAKPKIPIKVDIRITDSYFSIKTCYGCTLQVPWRGASHENLQHVFEQK